MPYTQRYALLSTQVYIPITSENEALYPHTVTTNTAVDSYYSSNATPIPFHSMQNSYAPTHITDINNSNPPRSTSLTDISPAVRTIRKDHRTEASSRTPWRLTALLRCCGGLEIHAPGSVSPGSDLC